MIAAPSATDATEHAADWMELDALCSPDQQSSVASFAKLIRRTGSTDAIEGTRADAGSELSQRIAEDMFAEIENRKRACGHNRYPFEVEQGHVKLKGDPTVSPYVMLLLMSVTKPTAGHDGSAALFEHLCTHATLGYLGGAANGATAIRFGSPRKAPLAKLSQALDDLCLQLAEGDGCPRPQKAKHLGDEDLDIVAWRHFPDSKAGKLILFGQCAGGSTDWQKKLADMDAHAFIKKWFRTMLVVEPIRLFFVPRRIPADDWNDSGIDGGILFDRCRIVACLDGVSDKLIKQGQKLAKAELKRLTKK
jgi:hypothetical protein